MKQHVLITAFTFPPDSNGVANAAYIHAKIMQELGCEVDVITYGDTISRNTEYGLSVARFPISGKGHLLSPRRGAIQELYAFLNENHWDIVFMHCWQTWSTNALLDYFATTSRPDKLVLVSHGISTNINIHHFPLNLFRRFLWWPYRKFSVPKYLQLLTKLVVLWDHFDDDRFFDNKLASRMGIPVSVIPNIARYNPMKVRRPPLRFSAEEMAGGFLLSVGNYSKEKNEFFVLDAYRQSQLNDIPLILVGHQLNGYSAKLEKVALHWNLRKVQFCERLSKEEIDWLYKYAKMFMSSSKTECQPLVLLDALASQTACISTDVGCVSDFPPVAVVSSPGEMAANIKHLWKDSAHRIKTVIDGLELYKTEFTEEVACAKWKNLLKELCDNLL